MRQVTGWGDTQLKIHLSRLVDLEYLAIHRNPNHAQGILYELVYAGEGRDGQRFLPGLIDVEALRKQYDANRSGQIDKRSGQNDNQSATGRDLVGGRSAPGRPDENPAQPSNETASGPDTSENGENEQEPPKKPEPES